MTRAAALARRHAIWLLPLLAFGGAALLEALHAWIGYRLAGEPGIGYTLRGQPLGFLQILARSLPSWLFIGLMAGGAARLGRAYPLIGPRWKRALPVHLAAAVASAAISLLGMAAVRHSLFVGPETGVTFRALALRYYAVYYNTLFLFYWASVGVYSAFAHYAALRERQVAEERLAHGLTQARLEALRAQLQPHFLFNTLNAVAGLAVEGDRQGTVRMLALVGDLLRLSLRRSQHIVPLAEELEAVELYLEIQRVRYQERLRVDTNVDPECYGAEVPTFLLQPLVENAIQHGVARSRTGGRVALTCARAGDRMHVTVEDSGAGFRGRPVYGIGLRNVEERLRQLYGDGFELRFGPDATAGGRVTVSWPFRRLPWRPREDADMSSRPRAAAG